MTGHPCGALPVSGWSASVWYCHTHQAFFAFQSSYIQSGDDVVEQLTSDEKEYGPFDSYTALQNWLFGLVSDPGTYEHLMLTRVLDERPF